MNVYEIITNKIVEALDAGKVPWRKPWYSMNTEHQNVESSHAYRGINPCLLSCSGRSTPFWATFNQIKKAGASVQAGEKGSLVVFWKVNQQTQEEEEDKDEKTGRKTYLLLRFYKVWNLDQIENAPVRWTAKLDRALDLLTDKRTSSPVAEAEAIWEAMLNRPGKVDAESPWYHPADDIIGIPGAEMFHTDADYYSAFFHELAHSTGHASRLARVGIQVRHDRQDIEYEELVAEFGSAFLCSECGLSPAVIQNQTAYIQNWTKALTANPKWIVMAAAAGQRAVDYIHGGTNVAPN